MPSLELWKTYDRRAVHDIFEPHTTFAPQTGTWGLQGIVRLQESPDDFVFFVTFGKSQGAHNFDEKISDDGVLTWQSQPKQKLDTPVIQRFIGHDDLTANIHLFLRTTTNEPYTYLGRLGYLGHDSTREQPVHFTWQLMDWPPPAPVVNNLGLVTVPGNEPVTPVDPRRDSLTQTPPPKTKPGAGKGGAGGVKATLPGQDAKNRALGLAGEKLVIMHEKARLAAAGRRDLADAILHVAVVEGDSAGYDIRSFEADGSVRHIEVKTTAGPASNAFFISPNEIDFSDKHPKSYILIRVHGYDRVTNSGNYYEQRGSVSAAFQLTPTEYRAKLRPAIPASSS